MIVEKTHAADPPDPQPCFAFRLSEPDGKLRFHFEPGTRYAYSGDGFILLQFVLERGLGLDLGREMHRRVFDRFGMRNTSMMWRPDFRRNLADGWDMQGKVEPHDERSAVRAAGSMDTTIVDFARFAAAFVRGDGLSKKSRAEITRPQVPITTPSQFPTLQPELPPASAPTSAGWRDHFTDLRAALRERWHNDTTGNSWSAWRPAAPASSPLQRVRAEAHSPSSSSFGRRARLTSGLKPALTALYTGAKEGFGLDELRRKAGANRLGSPRKPDIFPNSKQQPRSFRPSDQATRP